MKYAHIINGVVTNVILLASPEDYPVGEGELLVATDLAGPGWTYDGENFTPPVPEETPTSAIKVSRIDFYRLFTGMEQVKINALRKATQELSSADYGDPLNALLVNLEVVFQMFDMPDEFIEVDHDDTAIALMLLASAGVFGSDGPTITARQDRIKLGLAPL